MLREDLIYVDKNAYRYTSVKQEGYYSYSEIFRRYWPEGYRCDSKGRVEATTARVVNFKHLKEVLMSKDESLLEKNSWIFDGQYRFLDGESLLGNKVGFTSIPRSGNSFLRRRTEQVLGITSGSAMSIHTSTTLQINGLCGESHYDDRVWIAKTHHPIALKNGEVPLVCNKTFVIVRHPLDVLPSFFSLVNTTCHGVKVEFSFDKDYPEWWDRNVRKFAKRFAQFFSKIVE